MTEQRSEEAKVLTSIMLAVFRINGRLLEGGDRLVAPLDLTSARWQVLGAIALTSRPQTVPEIAERMGMTRQGAQKQINRLEADGFVESRPNPRHKRSPFYALTDSGASTYRAVDTLFTGWVNSLASGLERDRLKGTLALLNDIDSRLVENASLEGRTP